MSSAQRTQLGCAFSEVDAVFDDCLAEAQQRLSVSGLDAFLESARYFGKMGRGAEPLLVFLQNWPQTASRVGEAALPSVMQTVRAINKSPNGRAIAPFLQSLPAAARRLPAPESLQQYMQLGLQVLEQTSGSIHGIHKTYASPCLIAFFERAPEVLQWLSPDGLRNWAQYGIRHYSQQPEQQKQYFALQSSDSRAVLQRERHGTLLVDQMRKLDLYLLALWQDPAQLVPYTALPGSAPMQPYCDAQGIRLPDVYEDTPQVPGLDRYRVALAHMAAHRRWSTAIYADNYSPAQRLAIECFEDARVDTLCLRRFPGLRPTLLALLPAPAEDACNTLTHSGLRHQEDGSELDLDMALRAYTDLQAGSQPDARITQSHRSSGRSIAVTLLLDLSESLNDTVPGSGQSILELSQEAVALLAWTVEQLGDPLAIAGFHSNTRHDVRYLHIKGFGEHFGDAAKGRMAAMQAGYSTRMGAALRHAAHTLAAQQADTRLLLVLTDGRPADLDVTDATLLVQDARQAVKELAALGITSYCINLDAAADSYVRDVFGKQYTVVDRIASLPEKLPRLFMRLTR